VEAVILMGIQGSGKSTFYKRTFASTHLRISMDLARTRAREIRLMEECLRTKTPFVVDNTNSTIQQRRTFIAGARRAGFRVTGYYFPPDIKAALSRNAGRIGKERVPVPGIYRTLKYFQEPKLEEGFDELWEVEISGAEFVVRKHPDGAVQS
jgi:predicted kinase